MPRGDDATHIGDLVPDPPVEGRPDFRAGQRQLGVAQLGLGPRERCPGSLELGLAEHQGTRGRRTVPSATLPGAELLVLGPRDIGLLFGLEQRDPLRGYVGFGLLDPILVLGGIDADEDFARRHVAAALQVGADRHDLAPHLGR